MSVTAEMRGLTDRHRRAQILRARQVDRKVEELWQRFQAGRLTAGQWERAMVVVAASGYQSSRDLAAEYVQNYREMAIGSPTLKVTTPQMDTGIATLIFRSVSPADPLRLFDEALAEARKLAMRGGRDMIAGSSTQDRKAVGWRRVTDGDPCTFCAMLVGRGAVYKTQQSAGRYASRRFKGPGQYKFHNHCGCSIEPLYAEWEPTDAEAAWVSQYDAAAAQVDAAGLPRTEQNVLPVLRRLGDYRDSPSRRNKQLA